MGSTDSVVKILVAIVIAGLYNANQISGTAAIILLILSGIFILIRFNYSEVKTDKIFANAIHIPLHELRERNKEISAHKPIVVYCAGSYRSVAGSSIIKSKLNDTSQVFDFSEALKHFQK